MDIDIDAIRRVVEDADVFVVRFALIDQRLLVDARPDEEGRPYISMVPPVTSAEERYRFLQRERPGMPLPEQITVFQWPRPITVLRDVGIWRFIEDRLTSVGGEPARTEARRAFNDGQRLERADVVAAIRGGEGYETIWERAPQ
ncbi:MAG: hypothetical protein WD734_05985 [Dehalococcoidia bacterium]